VFTLFGHPDVPVARTGVCVIFGFSQRPLNPTLGRSEQSDSHGYPVGSTLDDAAHPAFKTSCSGILGTEPLIDRSGLAAGSTPGATQYAPTTPRRGRVARRSHPPAKSPIRGASAGRRQRTVFRSRAVTRLRRSWVTGFLTFDTNTFVYCRIGESGPAHTLVRADSSARAAFRAHYDRLVPSLGNDVRVPWRSGKKPGVCAAPQAHQ